jgi:hypothetical protein
VSRFDLPNGTATPNARGFEGAFVRRRFLSSLAGAAALGFGGDCKSVPGADVGESIPGIMTGCWAVRGDSPFERVMESIWPKQVAAESTNNEKNRERILIESNSPRFCELFN